MKSYFLTFILAVLFLASTFSDSFAQTDWTKYEGNPVLGPGLPGTWNDISLGPVSILFDGSTYHLWYGGLDGSYVRIGYATSEDGKSWTPYAENPVLDVGEEGGWEDEWVVKPYVLFDGDTYHMWYTGYNGTNARIGYATSPDRVTWTKDEGNPVMDKGSAGSWEFVGVESPCIIFDGSTYHMWYNGWDTQDIFQIGYATSTDRVTWTKYENNPILKVGPSGSWDYPRVDAPEVFFDGTKYHMWYDGYNGTNGRIGYATSLDGLSWTPYVGNPVLDLGEAESWDSQWVGFCRVLFNTADSLYNMWYLGSDEDWNARIGYATAPDDSALGIYDEISTEFPGNFVLNQNYPNPFNPSTTIKFTLPKTEFVELKVYNILGKELATLVSNKLNQGNHTYQFDGRNLASGIYYYQLVTGDYREVKKMILLR
jgi:predicted GH43/DUF377 family glycosyl hydrolase